MSMRITTKWDINLIPPLWKIVQTIRSRLARVSGTDSEQRVLLSVSAQHLRYSRAAFCDHITASVSHNSIHELPHKRCLNLFAILMSTREPQSDTCQEHLLRFSHGFKKEKKIQKNVHLFWFRLTVYNQRRVSNLRPPFFQFPTCLLSVKSHRKSVAGVWGVSANVFGDGSV